MRASAECVLVTGSTRGIGRAIALRLAQDGFDVVIHGRAAVEEAERVSDDVRKLGRHSRIVMFDVSDRDATAAALSADIESNGCYYGVVCNAGVASDASFPSMTGAEWDRVIHTNLDAFYNVLNPLMLPLVRRRRPGRIVTLASVAGLIGNRGQVNYSAAKAGLIGATKALALELATRQITVNCVAPGLIDTDMISGMEPAAIEEVVRQIPSGRLGRPDEVAAVVSFLMSSGAAYITRQVISVNGGMA